MNCIEEYAKQNDPEYETCATCSHNTSICYDCDLGSEYNFDSYEYQMKHADELELWKRAQDRDNFSPIISGSFSTVAELVAILSSLPQEYKIAPFGKDNCRIAVDHKEKVVFMDTKDMIQLVFGETGKETSYNEK